MLSCNVEEIVDKHSCDRGGLIAILEEVQIKEGYLSEKTLKKIAKKTGKSLVDIYGVATFYKSFSLKPRGKHFISICLGTACHVKGAVAVVEEFERQLKIKRGETTGNNEFTLETVNCLGACALGPIVLIDGHYFSKVKPDQISGIIEDTRKGLDNKEDPDNLLFPMEVHCPCCNHSLMDSKHIVDGLPSIRVTISFEGQHCGFSMSALYGSFNVLCGAEVPIDTIFSIFCPHCYAELVGALSCVECGASMIPMLVKGGGIIQVCARRGCKRHRLDINGVNI